MKYLLTLVLSLASLSAFYIPDAFAKECYGCSCRTECWRSGVCRTVCRDSCGHFCFADEPLGYTPNSAGVNPTGYNCPSSHPIKGNFTTYDGSKCIAHAPGGRSYARTNPERCYATMADAVAEGCRPARR